MTAKPDVPNVAIWSCVEFEEESPGRSRSPPAVLGRGVPFPDSESELRNFVDKCQDVDRRTVAAMFARTVDGPAFRMPLQQESNHAAFIGSAHAERAARAFFPKSLVTELTSSLKSDVSQ